MTEGQPFLSQTRSRDAVLTTVLVAAGFVALALVLRLPAFLYSVLNYDESMYLLMGDKMRQGFLPYTTLCDLKPAGLFAIFAAISALPMDGVIASRLVAAITVGLTAYVLCHIAGRLFEDGKRRIGPFTGLAYIVFMLADGGLNSQAELFMNALTSLALLLALSAIRAEGRPRLGLMLAAGLVWGIGIQVKQVVVFDMTAFLIGFFLLTTARPADLTGRVREVWPAFVGLGLMALVPTIVIILVYVVTGHWSAWVAGNLTAHESFYSEGGPPIAWDAGFRAMTEQFPLWLASLLALAFGTRLARSSRERRAITFLLVWVVLIIVCQIFLRFMSDHYFLQFLPPMTLLAAFLLGRVVLDHLDLVTPRRVLLGVLVGLGVFAVEKSPIMNALYVARDRYLWGQTWHGDAARQIAADLRPELRPDDAIYVVGFMPILYYLTGAKIPTRFAFTGLPATVYKGRDGCPWVPPEVELQRILDSNPRFIVVEQGIFYKDMDPPLKTMIDDRLTSQYRLQKTYDQAFIHRLYPFQRFVMNGAASAKVYERLAPATQPG